MDISSILKGAGIGAIIGAGIGASIGIYIQHRKNKKAEKEAAEEKLKEVNEYTNLAANYDTLTVVEDENKVNEFISRNFEAANTTSEPYVISPDATMVDRHYSVTPVNVEDEKYIPEEDPNDPVMVIPPENNYEFESEDPFEIDYQTFDQTCRQFDKIEVVYYDGDGEFIGDINGREEEIDYPDESFGQHVLDLFRDESGRIVKRKIWIRNPWERTDYEITYNTDSYRYDTYEDVPGGID